MSTACRDHHEWHAEREEQSAWPVCLTQAMNSGPCPQSPVLMWKSDTADSPAFPTCIGKIFQFAALPAKKQQPPGKVGGISFRAHHPCETAEETSSLLESLENIRPIRINLVQRNICSSIRSTVRCSEAAVLGLVIVVPWQMSQGNCRSASSCGFRSNFFQNKSAYIWFGLISAALHAAKRC